jgi:hypothetical protein
MSIDPETPVCPVMCPTGRVVRPRVFLFFFGAMGQAFAFF